MTFRKLRINNKKKKNVVEKCIGLNNITTEFAR